MCLPIPRTTAALARYANNIDDRAYKTFALSGSTAAELEYFAQIDTEAGFDFFSTAMKSSGGDPFAGGGSILQSGSSSTGGFLLGFGHNISPCTTATCSLGFRLTSDSSVTLHGAAIVNFTIKNLADK